MLQKGGSSLANGPIAPVVRPGGLTDRQVDVLRLVAQGLPNAAVAERLDLSERTVHAHLRAIFDKLGVNSRTAAARFAVKQNLA
jgi:DNA-binding NarL/FixJ family response regulator